MQKLGPGAIEKVMLRHLREAAELERSTHAYQNRTHSLQNSTEAFPIISSPDLVVAELRMGMRYAGAIVHRFELSNFPKIAANAAIEILSALRRLL